LLRSGAERRERLGRARLYLVTGAREDRGDLPDFLEAVLAAGVDIVQLREKDAEAGDLLRWSPVFRDAADRHGALFIVNDRPDVALVARADGVHLGQNDLPADSARALMGGDHIIGVSTHSEQEFLSAARSADYLCVGPVHETATKPGRPATGLGSVRAAATRNELGATERPWFAIGGIDGATLDEVIGAGARRVAVVRAVTEARDPALAVRELRARIRERVEMETR
jgi:thiamine-phosphate pyrophosphorylase